MPRVFMVDDSPIATRMVSDFLRDKGYEVEITNSPFGVSGKMMEYMPDVVLMDLGLPGLNGRSLIEIIRKKGSGLSCKVVVFSSTDEDEMKSLVEKGLADEYFTKGSSLNELEAKLRKLTA